MAIVAIVAAVALPSYLNSVTKSRRSEAIQALSQYQAIIERCYAANLTYTYTAATCPAMYTGGVTLPLSTAHGYYLIAGTFVAAPPSYSLQAQAQGGQIGDTQCAKFSVDQTNTRNATNGFPQSCWTP